jgi:1-acyl-sn-glycerol-3-phosphate acyltransferase
LRNVTLAAIRMTEGHRHRPLHPALRALRAARVTVHVFAGVATTTFVFPWVSSASREALKRRWSRKLLRMLKVHARVHGTGEEPAGNVLIVSNHVSWLDIFVLNAHHRPARFVAKSELAQWPVAGRLIRGAGTIFVERERRHDTKRVNHHAAEALAAGEVVVVFPEGTTSDGTTLLKFHGSLLQPIVEAAGHVQPVALRYRHPHGAVATVAAFVGDDTFAESFWRVCGERELVVDVQVMPPIAAARMHRRELARASEDAIRTALALPASATGPGRRADPET